MDKTIYSKEHRYLVDKLKRARNEAGLSQSDAAAMLHKTQSYISKIESGQLRVDIVQLKAFATIYNKDISYFIK